MPQTFTREILDLFDGFVHGSLSRRDFIGKATVQLGSAAAATAALSALLPDFAGATVVPEDDKRLTTSWVEIPSPSGSGSIKAYVAKAVKGPKKRGVVLVIHENRGLNPHIQDIARRLALDGLLAVAPDALTKLGGYPGDEDKARELFPKLDQAKIQADFVTAAHFAEALPDSNGKLGAVGFCYGGGVVNMLATTVPSLKAGVPFYGAPAKVEAVPAIKAELSLQFAGNDTRINGMWPAYEAALKSAGVKYEAFTYPGVEHGFNNDTTPRFNKEAADLAWARTLALFKRTLS